MELEKDRNAPPEKPTPPQPRYVYEGFTLRTGVVGDRFWHKLKRREEKNGKNNR